MANSQHSGSDSIFRPEVMAARSDETMGTILISAPVSRWLWIALATSLATAVVLFLSLGHYTRRETVSGLVISSAGLINITAPNTGIITRLLVKEGSLVKAGDLLFELSDIRDSAALGDTDARVGASLDEQHQRLKADLIDQQQLTQQQTAALGTRIALLRAQLTQVEGQLALQQQQVDSNRNLLQRIKPLGRQGYVSALQIQQQETVLLDAQTQDKSLTRQMLDLRAQLNAAEQQRAQLPLDEASKRNDTERQLAALEQSIAQNEVQRARVLRAPRAGVVSVMLIKEGQAVGTDQPMLSILPQGAQLQAQLLVPSRAIGFIAPNNRVVLRYRAFPYQKFGQYYGKVSNISRTALTPSEAASLTGQPPSESLYLVDVTPERKTIWAYGKTEALKPGMALDADLLMDRRRLIEWIFDPVFSIKHSLSEDTHD